MRRTFILIILILTFSFSDAQDQGRTNAIMFGTGIGISDGNKLMGGGPSISMGYLKSFKYDRLSFNPELNVGFYGARFIMDTPDMYFNSVNIDFNFWFDLLRFRGVSLTIGAGPSLNQMKGLIGTGGYPPGNLHSEYARSTDIVFKFGGGFKILPPDKKFFVEIFPLNFRVGNDYFMEGFAMVYLGYRL